MHQETRKFMWLTLLWYSLYSGFWNQAHSIFEVYVSTSYIIWRASFPQQLFNKVLRGSIFWNIFDLKWSLDEFKRLIKTQENAEQEEVFLSKKTCKNGIQLFSPVTFEELSLAKSWGSEVARSFSPLSLLDFSLFILPSPHTRTFMQAVKHSPLSFSQNLSAMRPFRALSGA